MIDPPFEENNPFIQHYAFLKGEALDGFDIKLVCSECSWQGLPEQAEKEETDMDEYDFRLTCPACESGLTTDQNLKKIIRVTE